jgi:hypothetical protein
MRIFGIGLIGVSLLGLAVGPACGAINTYTSLNDWNLAVTSPVTIDFSGVNASNSSAPIVLPEVTFTAMPGGGFNNSFWGAPCDARCVKAYGSPLAGLIASQLLSSTALGLAMNLATFNDPGKVVTVKVYLGSNTTADGTYTVATSSQSFFGLTSDLAIGKVEISTPNVTNGGEVLIDNFALSNVLASAGGPADPPQVDTPEVPTLGYIGFGFIAVMLGSRRRRIQ